MKSPVESHGFDLKLRLIMTTLGGRDGWEYNQATENMFVHCEFLPECKSVDTIAVVSGSGGAGAEQTQLTRRQQDHGRSVIPNF